MKLNFLDQKTRADLVKLIIFMIVTGLATTGLIVVIGNLTFESSRTYKAVFSDATGVFKGDDVRVAGVKVGTVKDVSILDRDKALVEFTVREATTVTKSSTATVRYRNLVGQRYISLTRGADDLTRLPAGGTIPLSRTAPALDLTVLFNGFKPLFAALSPADINKLSFQLIQVFQGEGANLEALLQSTGSVTTTLADRDELIGDVITNLNAVLTTVGDRDKQLSNLLIQFQKFVSGLNQDREAILGSLNSISLLAERTADITTDLRPSLVRDIKALRTVATNLNKGRGELDRALQILPIKLTKIGRTAIYGSFFNFYLCEFRGNVVLPTGKLPISYETFPGSNKGRCDLTK